MLSSPSSRANVVRSAIAILAVLAILTIGHWIPLVGIDASAFAAYGGDSSNVSIFAIGDVAIIEAAIFVELAARLVPRFRKLRIGGLEGRSKLRRAAILLSFVLAAFQAMAFARWIVTASPDFDVVDSRFVSVVVPLVVVQLVASVAILWTMAATLDRYGLGTGFVWIVGFFSAWELVPTWSSAYAASRLNDRPYAGVLLTLVIAVAASALLGFSIDGRRARERDAIPTPTAGLVPIWLAAVVFSGASMLASAFLAGPDPFGFERDPNRHLVAELVLIVVLALVLAREFARSEGGAKAGAPPSGAAMVRSVAFLLLVRAIEILVERQTSLALDVTFAVIAPAIVADLVAETRLRFSRGRLECVAIPSTMPDVDRMKRTLDEHGIAHVVRCEHLRPFDHLFGPLYETQVLVPVDDAESAREALALSAGERSDKRDSAR